MQTQTHLLYKVEVEKQIQGTTTGTATNKLIQSGQNFTSTVTNGDKVINQASGATALVTEC